MLKTAFLVAACSFAAFSAATARTVYSPQQLAAPTGWSLKVTPDPSSIWSWHETILVTPGETVRTSVDIDIDKNGVRDTLNSTQRVYVTDMQINVAEGPYLADDGTITAILRDTGGQRWNLTPSSNYDGAGVGDRQFLPTVYRLETPLILPVGSDLRVDITNVTGAGDIGDRNVEVNLIGRVVTL